MFIYVSMCVATYLYVPPVWAGTWGGHSPGTGLPGACEPSAMSAGQQTQVPYKSSKSLRH